MVGDSPTREELPFKPLVEQRYRVVPLEPRSARLTLSKSAQDVPIWKAQR
jgi:hypothetical protein